jgi:hypothetical protein
LDVSLLRSMLTLLVVAGVRMVFQGNRKPKMMMTF